MGPVIPVRGPSDERVDDYRNLTDAELRQREEPAAGLFMVEGVGSIRQLLQSQFPVRSLLVSEHRLEELRPALEAAVGDWPVYLAGNDVMRAVTGFRFHRGALAAANRLPPARWQDIVGGPVVAVAEGIGDHENLGALFRNAAAFGVAAILLAPNSVDPLYRRAVRVSMGHVLRVRWARIEPWPEALGDLKCLGYRLLALTPDEGAPPLGDVEWRGRTAVLLGAEGPGLSAPALARADDRARIPMAAGVDSLNVATAAAIAFHELARAPGPSSP